MSHFFEILPSATNTFPNSRRKSESCTNSCRSSDLNTPTSMSTHLPRKVWANQNNNNNHDTGHASLVRRISSPWSLHQTYKGPCPGEYAVAQANSSINHISSSASRLSSWHPQQSELQSPLNLGSPRTNGFPERPSGSLSEPFGLPMMNMADSLGAPAVPGLGCSSLLSTGPISEDVSGFSSPDLRAFPSDTNGPQSERHRLSSGCLVLSHPVDTSRWELQTTLGSWPAPFSTKAPSNEREALNGCLNLPTDLLIEVLKECMWQMERESHPRIWFPSHNPPMVLRSVCRLWNECFEEHTSLQLFVKATFSNKKCTQLFPRRSLSESANLIKKIIKTDAETYRLCDLALTFDDWSCYISNDTFKNILELVPRSTSLQITFPNGLHPLFAPDYTTITAGDNLLSNILARLEANSDLRSLYLKWDQNMARPYVLNGTISVQHQAGFLWKQLQHVDLNCRLSLEACHSIMKTCSEQLITASLGLVDRGDPVLTVNGITLPKLQSFALQTSGSVSEDNLVSFFAGLDMPSLEEIDFQLGRPNLNVAGLHLEWGQITKMILRCSISQEHLWNLLQRVANIVRFELYGNEAYSVFDNVRADIRLPHLTRLVIFAGQTMFASQPFRETVNGLIGNHRLESIQVPCIPNFPNKMETSLNIVDLQCPISLECCARILRDPGFQTHIQHATFYLSLDTHNASTVGPAINFRNLETLTLYSDADCHQLVEKITVNSAGAPKVSIVPCTSNILPRISGM